MDSARARTLMAIDHEKQDGLPDFDEKEIDRVMAPSISEQDVKSPPRFSPYDHGGPSSFLPASLNYSSGNRSHGMLLA